jgi:hypothetical protein
VPECMLLLYAPEVDEAERAERWAEMPLWDEVNASLREAGVLVKHGPLHSVATATTVPVRGDETELTDGPFAVTKEVLAGYAKGSIARILTRRSGMPRGCPGPGTGRSRCGRSWPTTRSRGPIGAPAHLELSGAATPRQPGSGRRRRRGGVPRGARGGAGDVDPTCGRLSAGRGRRAGRVRRRGQRVAAGRRPHPAGRVAHGRRAAAGDRSDAP